MRSPAIATAYRTATVEKRDVNSVLTGVGTIEPVSQATVAFPVSGTVKTIDVEVGDTVTAGQQLATLDTQSLDATLHQAEATLAEAKLTLQKALNGESVSAGSGNPQGQAKPTAATSSTSTVELTAASLGSTNAEVAAAQQRVLKAQQHVDAALAASDTATQSANTVCSAAGVGSAATKSSTTTSSTTAASEAASDAEPVGACKNRARKGAGRSGRSHRSPEGALSGVDSARRAPRTARFGHVEHRRQSQYRPEGARRVAAQRQARRHLRKAHRRRPILSTTRSRWSHTQAEVTVAEQAVAQATIVSPIAGQVVAVNLATGDGMTSGSSFTEHRDQGRRRIRGDHEHQRRPDQRCRGRASGNRPRRRHQHPDAGQGRVHLQRSGLLDQQFHQDVPSYVALANPNAELRNGGTATISIITKQATSALAVPTSTVVASEPDGR